MNAIAIGPLVFPTQHIAILAGIFVFSFLSSIFSRRVDPVVGKWSTWALIAGLVGGRLGHVALHWQSFSGDLWRAFAIWQGGFEPITGLVSALLASALFIRSVNAGLATAATLGASVLVATGTMQLTKVTSGQIAPTVALQQVEGPPLAISDVAGKPVVVNLWASWCPPCRREMPLLAKVAASRNDVVFLFVNQGESAETIRSYLASQGLKLNHVLLDPSMQMPRHYRTLGLPMTLFLKADGTLAAMHMGEISPEALDTNINKLAGAT